MLMIILIVSALLLTIAAGIGKVPLWVAVLLLASLSFFKWDRSDPWRETAALRGLSGNCSFISVNRVTITLDWRIGRQKWRLLRTW